MPRKFPSEAESNGHRSTERKRKMNGYERTVRFVRGEAVDRPPFMPLVI